MREIDAQRMESDLRKTLGMDTNMPATDRVLSTIAILEVLVDESMLRDIFKPDGQWQDPAGRIVSRLMVKGMQLTTFRERVTAQLRFEGRNDTNPDEVQAMMLDIARKADAGERGRALDTECGRRIAGDRNQPEKRRSEKTER